MPDDTKRWADETISNLRDTPPRRRGQLLRRAGIGLLVTIVVLAAVDLLGPRTGETTVQTGTHSLGVEFPQIARAGEPAPLHITVDAAGGFGDVVQLRVCAELFDDLDFQNWYPNPSSETAQPPWVFYEFDPPPAGDTLEISLDARVAPGQLGGINDCQISVLVEDEPVVSATFTTWRMP
ncbi:hypothetical protein [Nocardioides sp.]|uniref:hypothetical protein n=1 Tax=Nocardioides sp. TaxID=35761 RepID=UPI002D80D068|nr:hypothetical protein [Nocardioides sp.]